MFFLPEIQGRFAVGAISFVTPVRPACTVGSAKLRNSTSAAFCLQEVAFTAYYPAELTSKTAKKGVHWLIRPLKESLHGMARFISLPSWVLWPVVYLYGALLKIPVHPNAPLLSPTTTRLHTSERNPGIDQWPLVIFSHGLGGSRHAYSQICSRLAASGKVVIAIEHRDGTGLACTPREWGSDGKMNATPLLYYRDGDVTWEDSNKPDGNFGGPLPLRTDQLVFRRQEVYIAYQACCRFIENDRHLELGTIDEVKIDKSSWTHLDVNSGKPPVCCTADVALVGHSFGGCTVLSILSTKPPPSHGSIPVTNALVLDPWLEPLPSPGPFPIPSDPSSSIAESVTKSVTSSTQNDFDIRPPRILVLVSEGFTLWRDHYARLQDVIRGWEPDGQRMITLIGSWHSSFSDTSTLPLLSRNAASTLMDVVSELSIAFLDGNVERALKNIPRRKMETEIVGKKKNKYGGPKRRLVGNIGEIIVM